MDHSTFDAIAVRLGTGTSRRKLVKAGVGAALLAALGRARIAAASCAYGYLTCKSGFVWREAVYADYVCVTPDQRDQAAYDNANAPSRVDPNSAYGPQSCISGYVWRVATEGDLVCVEPWVRDRVWYDNQPDVILSRQEPGCNSPLAPPPA